jgi:Putative addiction module component.
MSSEESIQEDVSIPDWHMEIVEERLARYRSEGMQGTPWEEFEKELIELVTKPFKD